MILNNNDYYNNFVASFIRDDQLNLSASLVEVLKNGSTRVTKKSVKEKYPKSKDFLATFSKEYPDVFQKYKDVSRDKSNKKITNADFIDRLTNGNEVFDEKHFAQFLAQRLDEIQPGSDQANTYHSFMIGVLQFILDGSIIYPRKEREINEGRKRIDICYTNSASVGFFSRMAVNPNVLSQEVMVECKNYTKDPKNPEFDQLRGRFSPRRGKLGILLYRNTTDKALIATRCRDIAIDDAGYIIALDDKDVHTLLKYISDGRRSHIDIFLQERYNYLIS